VSVGNVHAEGTDAQGRPRYTGELTLRNDATVADLPYTPMKKTIRVSYGDDLTEADIIPDGTGAAEAGFIAPQRAATHTFHFTLPKGTKAKTVIVEVTDMGSALAVFKGKITESGS
jgi:hypothetical protein